MNLLIAGTRSLVVRSDEITRAFWNLFAGDGQPGSVSIRPLSEIVTCVISGGAAGPDTAGELWAREVFGGNGRVVHFRPDYKRHGKWAPKVRNYEMAVHCTHALIFWDGRSKGTMHMIEKLEEFGKPWHSGELSR